MLKLFKNKSKQSEELSFIAHLNTLRWNLLRAITVIIVFAILAFVYKDFLFNEIILLPKSSEFITNRMFCDFAQRFDLPALCINANNLQLINIDMAGQFRIHIHISIITGLVLASPYVVFEVWRFIKPALSKDEKKIANRAVFFISMLFIIGIAFSYFIIVPLTIDFLGNYHVSDTVFNNINLKSYIGITTSVVLATGIAFELPIFIYFFSKIGLLKASFLKKNRKYAIVILLILAAIITPPDAFSQLIVFLPLYMLYEISIILSKIAQRNKK